MSAIRSAARRRAPQGGKVADPAWRHARAVKAGASARRAYERQRLELGEQFPSKGHAFAAGYRRGYQTAMAWWRRKTTPRVRASDRRAREEA